jgi:hypothetical protein
MFDDVQRELSRLWSSLGAAIERTGRELAQQASRRVGRIPRAGPVPTRLPPPRVHRPVPHPLVLPRRVRGGLAGSVLDRQRAHAARRRRTASPLGEAVKAGAARLADRLRQRLLDLQHALRGLQQRLDRRWEGER